MVKSLLSRFVKNPWINLLVGAVAFFSGLSEALAEIDHPSFGAHHGVMLLGLSSFVESAERILSAMGGGARGELTLRGVRRSGLHAPG